ncbi:Integrase catalytic domain-containing protein [Citrus sinensis]|uniref:Integrase catalytic domain-containing protein n=1 Tax=Citrus sinensis TaxID=2711 RepID=A0ACB8IPX5_CITSI|nr:Integrase catalytic domain-containing protein [Citrus sinensis]
MIEGETSRIGERSTETISGDTSGGRRDLSNRYSTPIIGGQKIDVEKFDGKINFGMWRREVMDALIQIDLDFVLKNKKHLYDEEIWDRMNEKACGQIRSCLTKKVKYLVKDDEDWAIEKQKKRGGKNSRSKSRSRNIARDECAFCHEKGHWRKDCPKAQKRDVKKPPAANMARKNDGSDYSLSITHAAYVASSSEWILDTGATYHLCHIKEWFTDFCNLESGAVVMGNDQSCRTMEIETIRLKMFDGMIRELKEVRFVPALKKNPISVGALEAKGYKITIEDGTMKFTHGAMVILQGIWRHNLYYLKGGKKTRVKFGTANNDTREILEYVHSDVWGPTKTASISGSHYFVIFVDDFSRHVWLYTMRAKDEVIEIFVKWKILVETQTGRKIKILRSNNGGEYTSDPFLQVCQNEGIKRHFTVRHTPQQNGVAERMNRTLLEKVRCMLSNAGLDKKFWAEAVSYASHLVNWLPSAAIGGKTPMEMWSGKYAQDYDSLRVFGCPAYYHVKDGKLDPRARKTIFVGFKGGVKGFKLWDLEDKKFVENKTKEVLQRVEFDATPYVPVSSTSKKSLTMEVTPRVEELVVFSDVPQNEETIDDVDNDDFIATRRPRREIKKLGWLTKDMVVAYALPVIDDDIPNTFGETLRSSESDQWKLAMEEEMKSLHQNQTWELVKLPKGKMAIGNKWVYTKKVAGKENHVCWLIKSLYGLKQSPRQWYKRFDQFIQGQKFTRSEHDHCVYFRRLLDGAFIYLLLYVDDMLIASKNRDEIERLKKQLASEFEMKDLCDAQRILGMKIRRDKKNGSVWLTQKSYLKKVLERFGMDDKTKPVCTHLAPHFKLSSSSCPRSQEERDYMARVLYVSAVDSLMYAMVCTRPDISQAVSMVSRYMHNPGKNQWLAVKWILRYLYGTVDVGLLFKNDCGQQCVGYCDSDFVGDLDKRRSTTGYVFTLGGGPVSWRSILQSTVALSTTEAEYMAATEAVKEAIWLKGLLGDLGVIQDNIAVFCDNQSTKFLAKNQTYHVRTKHIDVKYHYVREIIESGVVLLRKIDTKDNPSDMLTKPIDALRSMMVPKRG